MNLTVTLPTIAPLNAQGAAALNKALAAASSEVNQRPSVESGHQLWLLELLLHRHQQQAA